MPNLITHSKTLKTSNKNCLNTINKVTLTTTVTRHHPLHRLTHTHTHRHRHTHLRFQRSLTILYASLFHNYSFSHSLFYRSLCFMHAFASLLFRIQDSANDQMQKKEYESESRVIIFVASNQQIHTWALWHANRQRETFTL